MYKVTDSEIEDIIETAGYGMNYWAVRGVVDSEARTYTVTTDPDLIDDEEPATLSYDYLLEVAFSISEGQYEVSENIRSYFIDWRDALKADDEESQWAGGSIDSDAGDVLVQIAIHGEIVYG
tara:strand:- start:802 stop:1167 length:366 start_codon:yes stop_codon:yes gene_type:complete